VRNSMSKLGGARRRSQLRSTVSPSPGGGIGISRQYEAHRPAWGVSRCAGDFREQPKVTDAASELLPDALKDNRPCRLVYGVAKSSVRHSGRAGGFLKWNDGASLRMRRVADSITQQLKIDRSTYGNDESTGGSNEGGTDLEARSRFRNH